MQNKYMNLALKEAKKAYKKEEIPVGAVIVYKNKVIAKAHNLVEKKKNATYHAEILAIKKASEKIKNWRLIDCEMYVTLEPCNMCMDAIELSRIKKVYYSVKKDKKITSSKVEYKNIGDYSSECLKLIQNFFKKIR